jgi:hypothetical protein
LDYFFYLRALGPRFVKLLDGASDDDDDNDSDDSDAEDETSDGTEI